MGLPSSSSVKRWAQCGYRRCQGVHHLAGWPGNQVIADRPGQWCRFRVDLDDPGAGIAGQMRQHGCQVMLVVGTSATVHPAAMLPLLARDVGARVIEINPEPTPLTGTVSDYLIPGPAGRVVDALATAVSAWSKTS